MEPLISQAPDLAGLEWALTDKLPVGAETSWRKSKVQDDAYAFLQYTSGSTSFPKGVMLSHGNLWHNSQMIKESFGLSDRTIWVGWLPLYHDFGLIGGILQPFFAGGRAVFMSPHHFIQHPHHWLQAISRHRGTLCGGPNFGYELCIRKVTDEQCEGLDLNSWIMASIAAEPIRPDTLERFSAKFARYGFKKCQFFPSYGLAEATVFTAARPAGLPPMILSVDADSLARKAVVVVPEEAEGAKSFVSVGRTDWLSQKVVLVDPETKVRVAEDRCGEVWIAGQNVASGYWNLPQVTEETFRAYLADTGEGPFLRTGDLAFAHEGNLYIAGRLKDLIIVAGANHYPQDIELTVERSHARLRPGCTAAFSVDIDGEERVVVVQETDATTLTPEEAAEIKSAVRRAVSAYHGLRAHDIVLIAPRTIPKTSSGKIQRRATREMYLQSSFTAIS